MTQDKPSWRLVTDEATRQLYLCAFGCVTGNVWINDDGGVWVKGNGDKVNMITPPSISLTVPPSKDDEWANQAVTDLEEYYKNRNRSNDDNWGIHLVPLLEHKTILTKTSEGWEMKNEQSRI